MAEDIAAILLQILGAIVIIGLFSFFAGIVAGFAVEMLGAVFAIPAVLMVICASYHLIGAAFERWTTDSEKIVKFVSCAIKAVVKGAVAIANFVYKNVIKKVFEASKKLFESVTSKTKNNVLTETVTNPIPAQ